MNREKNKLESLARLKVGFAFSSAEFASDPSKPKLLRGLNVKRGYLDWCNNVQANWTGNCAGLDAYLLEEGDLVIAMDGALVGRSYATVAKEDLPAYLVQRVARVRAHDDRSKAFLHQIIGSTLFRRHVDRLKTDGAVPHITAGDIRSFQFPVFDLDTQQRFGDVLSLFDQCTNAMQRLADAKIKLKRGLAQQLLTGKKRFAEFRDRSWSEVRLSDCADPVKRKNGHGCTRVLTASGEHGLVDQRQYFNRNVAAADLSGYYVLQRGEFAYNRSAMNGYPYGAIKRLDAHDEGALSTLYLCFSIADERLDSNFLLHVFDNGVLNKQLRRIVRVGSRAHGLLNVAGSDFFSVSIPLPSLEEQRTVAGILDGLEREIGLLEKQRDLYKQYKRGLMSRLLSGEIQVPA